MQKITITIEQDGSKPVIFGIDQTEEDKQTAESILAEADGQEHTGNEQPKKTTAAQPCCFFCVTNFPSGSQPLRSRRLAVM